MELLELFVEMEVRSELLTSFSSILVTRLVNPGFWFIYFESVKKVELVELFIKG